MVKFFEDFIAALQAEYSYYKNAGASRSAGEAWKAIEYSNKVIESNLSVEESFVKIANHFRKNADRRNAAFGWDEAHAITLLWHDAYTKQNPANNEDKKMPASQFNMAEATKRAAGIATELSALLKQIAAHS